MAFVACTQNEVEELSANRADAPETLTVGFEGGDTRIELNEAVKTVWTEGDEVSVFYRSYENTRWAFQGETGDRSCELRLVSGEVGAQTMDNSIIVYPYSDSYAIDADTHAVAALLPAVQSYKEGSYGAEGNIMVAESKFTQFTLKSIVGWLRVELTGNRHIVNSITLRGNDGEQVAGLCYINAADASIALAESEVDESLVATEVRVDCGSGVTLDAEATEFYIALLPQTFDKGLTVEVDYANAEPQTLVYENAITIRRNHISPINSEAESEAIVSTNQIWYTATALIEPNSSAFNVAIISNEWDEATGEGVITFDGELTEIGDYAFDWRYELETISFPSSVTKIGEDAFCNCDNLKSVSIPNSVSIIGNSAFRGCDSLQNIVIPESVETIDAAAFSDCVNLSEVTFNEGLKVIGNDAFRSCTSLKVVSIPNSVTTLKNFAFTHCYSLENVMLGSDIERIEMYVFEFCNNLKDINIPNGVKVIGDATFGGCESLTRITIPDGVAELGGELFNNCVNLKEVYCDSIMPPTLTGDILGNTPDDLRIYVYEECVSLYKESWSDYQDKIYSNGKSMPEDLNTTTFNYTSTDSRIVEPSYLMVKSNSYTDGVGTLVVYGTLSAIPNHAFDNCYTLKTIELPDGISIVGGASFAGCNNLESIVIPDSVLKIGDWAFNVNTALKSVVLGENVISIGNWAFYGNESLEELVLPESITEIGGYTFENCTSLRSITFPNHEIGMGFGVFQNCSSLEEIKGAYATADGRCYAPNNVINLFAPAGLTEYTIPDEITGIGQSAFDAGIELESITFNDNLEWCDIWMAGTKLSRFFGSNVSEDGRCLIIDGRLIMFAPAGITEYIVPENVTSIEGKAFMGHQGLTSVTLPDGLKHIYGGFYGCSNLETVNIPTSVEVIGSQTFEGCTKLSSITIPESVTEIQHNTFNGCASLAEVSLPESLRTISSNAFTNCSSLQSMTIGANIENIEDGVFMNCYNLTNIYCKATTPPTLGDGVFKYWNEETWEYFNIGCTIYVPTESVEAYKSAAYWSEYASSIVGYDFETGEVAE